MTLKVTYERSCDICGCEIMVATISGYAAAPPNQYKTNNSKLLDLCDECNAPLDEALRRRVVELADK